MSELIADLGYRPRPWQAECRQAMKRFTVLVVHRRGGKTVLAVVTLVDAALRTAKKDGRYAYIAPYRKQAKEIAWDYLKAFGRKVPGAEPLEGDLTLRLPNGSRVSLFGADDPDRLRGLYFDGLVVDELKDIKPEVWGEILRPALADRKGWALFIGTPKGQNLLSQLYFDALGSPDWHAALYKWRDTMAVDEEEIEAARRAMSEAQFAQEFECDFAASSDDALITLALVEESCRRAPRDGDIRGSPKILGVDPARYGDDASVIFPRQGLVAYKPRVFRGIDNVTLAGEVAGTWDRWGADACFVDEGAGAGVIDHLRHVLRRPAVGIHFGGKKAVKRGYFDKRSEMWGTMAQWLKDGGAIPNDPDLKAELCGPRMDWSNAQNLMKLESKDSMRSRGLASPNLGDALALTFAQPVAPRIELESWIPKGYKARGKTRLES